jgi:molecular chaperone GrpE (heat shock protein)
MVNFEAELEKLLIQEQEPLPNYELAEFAAAERELLAAVQKKQTDLSLQVEEIYDLVKEGDTRVLQEALSAEKGRTGQLALAVIGLCDMLEDFCTYARQSGNGDLEHQGFLLWKNSGALLEGCGITRLGEEGQPLDPAIHRVQAAATSFFPREYVAQVLQSGYRYLGTVVRRAAVVLSTGTGTEEKEEDRIE